MKESDVLAATNTLLTLLNTLGTIAGQAAHISSILSTARAEGRATLTETEWAQIRGADDAARRALQEAIERA